ncbi:type II toxin-antitoxin system VapC family toxin [Rubellimicrobium rubrum]|uniref:Type II toxin-antitoxin system VapC family toxin n=1 Tax=Rubellimicrobium rubrum TaxID=2585369 RepID=A0A5C4MXZ1_9RHOB|nr:type II toxin-antitoxin system VapC family toxin [Rubellimicrobium rubrum]TNC49617.1 type II toxin-antitoxin system VapC family toxin [Rubellimicrobium rubrum]
MSKAVVLDSSALLCLLNGEAGADRVAEALPSAVIGAVNLAEVVTKLRERGLSAEEVEEALGGLNLDVRPLRALQAYATGHLRPATRSLGLSLGDRACLALAAELSAPALTADQAWSKVEAGVAIQLIR